MPSRREVLRMLSTLPLGLAAGRVASIALKLALVLLFVGTVQVQAQQQYELLLKGGHVIDPKNAIDTPRDVAVADGKIARVAADIPASSAERVVDASGLYVTPGLIDLHAHVFFGTESGSFAGGFSSVSPDNFSFRSGVTTMVDAGNAGWRNFSIFKEQVIDQSRTRVLAFLNIFGYGLTSGRGIHELDDLDTEQTIFMARQHSDVIVGTRVGHFLGESWIPFERAMEAAQETGLPLFLECHLPELPLKELLGRMRPGDIFTHAFGDVGDRTSILDGQGRIRDYVLQAKQKGVVFDVGHGGGSFHYSQAIPALQQGLLPDTFGTDLHRSSMNGAMKDILNLMSRYLNLGVSLPQLVERATWRAARVIGRVELGHLSEGAVADVAVLDIEEGDFAFVDAGGYKIKGTQKLEAELTIRAGEIVWDLNGLSAELWK